MTENKQRVIGALIGLARATDGNEHLITPESTATVIACLRAEPENEAQLQKLLLQIEEAKRKMVPDCFHCANPCGKNSEFNLRLLENEQLDIRDLKYKLLDSVCQYAASKNCNDRILYMALIAIGIEDYSAESLKLLLNQVVTG